MNSPYFFASICDEYARRGEHVEIIRPNGERVLFCGTSHSSAWMESAQVQPDPAHPTEPVHIGKTWQHPAPEREMPVEYPKGWWKPYLLVFAAVLVVCGAFKSPWF